MAKIRPDGYSLQLSQEEYNTLILALARQSVESMEETAKLHHIREFMNPLDLYRVLCEFMK